MTKRVMMTEITRELLTLPDLQLNRAHRQVLDASVRLLRAHSAFVCLPGITRGEWVIAYRAGEYVSDGDSDPPLGACRRCFEQCSVGFADVLPDGHYTDPSGSVIRVAPDHVLFRLPVQRYPSRTLGRDANLVICVRSDPKDPNPVGWTDDELVPFAQICALFLENALRDEQQFILQQSGMVAAAETVTAVDELAQAIAERLRFEACTIFTVTKDTSALRVVGTTGLASDRHREEWKCQPNASNETFDPIGHVALTRDVYASNDVRAEWGKRYVEVLPDDFTSSTRRQFLGVPVFSRDPAGAVGQRGELVGVLRLYNKVDDPDFKNRPIDCLDIIQLELIAAALSPALRAVETEIIRDEAVTRMRHDMWEPIHLIRDAAGKYAERPLRTVQQDLDSVHQELKDIVLFCDLLYMQVHQSRVLSYTEITYNFEKIPLASDVLMRLATMFQGQCAGARLEGVFVGEAQELPHLYLDQSMMFVAFYNLLHNAVKYSDRDTSIRISISEDAESYRIAVSNYGIGIEERNKERVFEKWFRTKAAAGRKREGLGLGLYHVRQIVDRHGGRVAVTSLSNPTTITVTLPQTLSERRPG